MSGSKKISELTVTTALSGNDRVVVLTNPTSSAQTQATTLTNLATKMAANMMPKANSSAFGVIKIGSSLNVSANGEVYVKVSNTVPANSTANGEVGTIAYDSNYFYICVAINSWVRANLSTW